MTPQSCWTCKHAIPGMHLLCRLTWAGGALRACADARIFCGGNRDHCPKYERMEGIESDGDHLPGD